MSLSNREINNIETESAVDQDLLHKLEEELHRLEQLPSVQNYLGTAPTQAFVQQEVNTDLSQYMVQHEHRQELPTEEERARLIAEIEARVSEAMRQLRARNESIRNEHQDNINVFRQAVVNENRYNLLPEALEIIRQAMADLGDVRNVWIYPLNHLSIVDNREERQVDIIIQTGTNLTTEHFHFHY